MDDGTKESPRRQEQDCRAVAGVQGWTVADVYVDRDLSAFSGVERPEFERLLRDLEAGVIDGVVAWRVDRLVRRPRDFERVWQIIEPRGLVLASATEPIDTSSDVGGFIARVIVGMAEMESKATSRRVRRAKLQARVEGRPKDGGHRGFGHTRSGEIVPEEAGLIRDAATRILAGAAVATIAREWAAAGVQTPTGGAWSPSHLRRLLMQARLAGAREGGDGAWHASGAIIPIIDEPTARQLRAILSDPRRRTNHGRVSDALLTGLLHCGNCGAVMTTSKVRTRRMYGCRNRPDRPGCGKVSVSVDLADAHITRLVLDALDTPNVVAALNRPDDDPAGDVADRLLADREALARLAVDHYAHRRITEAEYTAARVVLEERIREAERALSRRGSVLASVVSVRDEWEARDVDWRRNLMRLLVARVDCAPASKPLNRWNPDRLSVEATYSA